MWCSRGIRAIQGRKCDQLTQCLKRHGIKRHGAYWFLKRHSTWVIWICHLMPVNRRKHHLKLYQSYLGSPETLLHNYFHLNWSGSMLVRLSSGTVYSFGFDFIFLTTFFFCFLLIAVFSFLNFVTASFLIFSFCFWSASFFCCFSFYSFNNLKIFIWGHPKWLKYFFPHCLLPSEVWQLDQVSKRHHWSCLKYLFTKNHACKIYIKTIYKNSLNLTLTLNHFSPPPL